MLTAVRAYRLFNHFDRAVRSGANEGTFTFDDTVVIFLRTLGAHSDGFHFIGRTDGVIEPRALGVVRATTHSFATICNQFVSGVATYVSGRIAKLAPDSIRLETPAAIVGVRGTTLAINVQPQQ